MDMIWTTVDFYRQGVLQARGRCLESEALAHSRLGVLYHKVCHIGVYWNISSGEYIQGYVGCDGLSRGTPLFLVYRPY